MFTPATRPAQRWIRRLLISLVLVLGLSACSHRSAEENLKAGKEALSQHKPADAFQALEAASHQDNAEARYYLALLLEGTIPGAPEKNIERGEELLRQSADQGFVPAEGAYCMVTAMRVDTQEALPYCQKAAQAGNGLGIMVLGMIHKDPKEMLQGLHQVKTDCSVHQDPLACFAAQGVNLSQ